MAINKVLSTTSFYIEVENGVDKTGAKVYKKKTFSGVKPNVDPENIFQVAEAIKDVLNASARDSYLNESSKLVNA
ncbi:DUF1659 domain-containing protein [Clostridium sp. UBA1056]|uniref:DUF1659 domain-containing protein n=1 Tax=unclassified Clostridium TaxID=2614128 RepID=UPI003217CA08